MTINIAKRYGLNDILHLFQAESVIADLNINQEKEVELSFDDCTIIYPLSGLIMNKIFRQLDKIEGAKKLVIIQNYSFAEISTLLNTYFLGCKFGGMNAKKPYTEQEITTKLKNVFKRKKIEILLFQKETYEGAGVLVYTNTI